MSYKPFQYPELVIEDELRDLLFTDVDCTPLFMPFIHRSFRRAEDGSKINCPSCNPKGSSNGEGSVGCPYCHGLGWMWDDKIINGWIYGFDIRKARASYRSLPHGRELSNEMKLVTLDDQIIHPGDYILDAKLNKEKRLAVPIQIQERFICVYSDRYSSNQSNSEYNVAVLHR